MASGLPVDLFNPYKCHWGLFPISATEGAIILIIIRRRGRRELSLGPIIEPGPY